MQARSVRCFVSLIVAAICLIVWVLPAGAVPAFARKYDLECTTCHSAWPTLNAFGRDFKVNGYRLREEVEGDEEFVQTVSDFLQLDKGFPISAGAVLRPFDKKKGKTSKIRAFHEFEVMFAGRIYKNVSTFVEVEAEDEDEFNVFVDTGTVTWSPLAQANVSMGWAPVFWNDPFNTLTNGRRMTRGSKGALTEEFAAGQNLAGESQWLGFYGRAADDRVFYMGGVSSGGEDREGGDSKDGYGRVMVEATSGVNVGGFLMAGTNQSQGADQSFTRAGIDFQIEKGGLTLYGLALFTNDDVLAPDGDAAVAGTESTTTGYVEGFYVVPVGGMNFVPLVRVDFLSDVIQRTDLTLNMGVYLVENIKTYFEWWQTLESPEGDEDKWRATWQIAMFF